MAVRKGFYDISGRHGRLSKLTSCPTLTRFHHVHTSKLHHCFFFSNETPFKWAYDSKFEAAPKMESKSSDLELHLKG